MNNQGNMGAKILLVDDEPSVSRAIKMLLEYDGYKVSVADSGESALALFAREPFDIVITDFSMFGMNGGELAARIKQLRPEQLIILATASIYKLEKTNSPIRTVDFVLDKPFGLKELREAIAYVKTPKNKAI